MVDDLKHIDGTDVDNKERENEDITNYFKVINQKFNKTQAKQGESDINKLTQYDPLSNNLWVKRKTEFKRIFKYNNKSNNKNNTNTKLKGYGCETEDVMDESDNNSNNKKTKKNNKKSKNTKKSSQNMDYQNNQENNDEDKHNDMVDSDDEIILKDKNDILNDELMDRKKSLDNDIDEKIGQFDLFGKILSHNAKFERQKKIITANEDQIEFIDENLI